MIEPFDTEEPSETKKKTKSSNSKTFSIFSIILSVSIVVALAVFSFNGINSLYSREGEKRYPVLIGDIGGTYVRLSLLGLSKDPDVEPIEYDNSKLSPKNFFSLESLLKDYLSKHKDHHPITAVLGIPGPVQNNEILGITNIPHWKRENGDEMGKILGIRYFLFLNDFACMSYGIQTKLKRDVDYIVLNDVPAQEGGVKAVIGPRTGLGMAFLVKDPSNQYYTIGTSEGGHQDYSPKSREMYDLTEFYKSLLSLDNISIERLLSGQAMIPIYKFLHERYPEIEREPQLAAKIDNFRFLGIPSLANEINVELTQKGVSGQCKLARKVLETFIGIFGEASGDISLMTLPTNGLYLVGSISVAIEPLIKQNSIFMEHFLNKDNFAYLLKTFPVYLVKNRDIGMIGARECARRLILDEL